jgi:hypothetical protein
VTTRTAILVIDDLHKSRTRAEIQVQASEVAENHNLVLQHTICAPNPDLAAVLEYVSVHNIAVIITPSLGHIKGNAAWVLSRCDLITLTPPSLQRRRERLVVK